MVVCGRAEMRENIPLNLVHWVFINSNNHTFMFQTMVPYHMTNKHPYICNCLIFNLQILNQKCPVSDQDDLYDWRLIKVQDMGNSHLEMENAFSINTLTFPYCPTPAKCLSELIVSVGRWKNGKMIQKSKQALFSNQALTDISKSTKHVDLGKSMSFISLLVLNSQISLPTHVLIWFLLNEVSMALTYKIQCRLLCYEFFSIIWSAVCL